MKKKKKEVVKKNLNFVSNVDEDIYQQLTDNIKKVKEEQTVKLILKIRKNIKQKMDDQRKFPAKVYPFTTEDMKKYNIYLPDFQHINKIEQK